MVATTSHTRSILRSRQGLTLIELIVVIIVIGILATVALRSGQRIFTSAKVEDTRQEMEQLAIGVAGNPDLQSAGVRSDFGYVGDVGSLPPNLDALVTNPGLATWNGPYYISKSETAPSEFKQDAWGSGYTYTGTDIVSVGSGSSLTQQIALSADDLLRNQVRAVILDSDGTPPGTACDSVVAEITYPNGSGSYALRVCTTDAGGYISFDSIPIGNHTLLVECSAGGLIDTVQYSVAVSPGTRSYAEYRLARDVISTPSSGVGGLVGHWKLDEVSGDTAHDASGNGNHGVLTNMNSANDWTTGRINGALDFDGFDDVVYIPDADILDDTEAITYMAWVYPTVLDGNPRGAVSKRIHYYDNNAYSMFFYGGDHLDIDVVTNNDRFATANTFTANQWYHLAVVFDGTLPQSERVKVFVDGAVTDTASESSTVIPNMNSPLVIGQLNGNSDGFFYGLIDDVRVYNRALTDSEINQLYQLGN